MEAFYGPSEEEGFFEGASEAGLLVPQTGAGIAVFSGAINAVAPIQVLVVRRRLGGCARRREGRGEQGSRDRSGEGNPEQHEGSGRGEE